MGKASVLVILMLLYSASGRAGEASREPQWFAAKPVTTPARIVSLAPSTTEVLFAIGAGPRVVAVTRYCDYPEAVQALPKLGGPMDVSVEAVLALRPDLVVGIVSRAADPVYKRLGELGIATLAVPSDALDEFPIAVTAIAAATHNVAQGAEVASRFATSLAELRQRTANAKSIRTLVLVADHPLVAAGRGSFIDGALTALKLENVVGTGPFPEVGREDMLHKNPELILALSDIRAEVVAPLRNARLLRVDDARLLRLTPRLPDALRDLARRVRP